MCQKVALEWTAASQECFSNAGVSCPSRPIHMDAHTHPVPHTCASATNEGPLTPITPYIQQYAQVWGALVRQSPRTFSLIPCQPRELGISSTLQMKKLGLTRITSPPTARVFLCNHWNSICVTPTSQISWSMSLNSELGRAACETCRTPVRIPWGSACPSQSEELCLRSLWSGVQDQLVPMADVMWGRRQCKSEGQKSSLA